MPTPAAARRTGLALVATAAVMAVLSSCGGGSAGAGRHTPAPSGSAASSPATLAATLLAVNDRLYAQSSYVITTTTSGGLTSTEVHDGDAVSLDQTDDYGHLEAIRSGDDVWVRKDSAASWSLDLRSSSAPAAATGVDPASLVGHWVLVTGTRLASAGIPLTKPSPVFAHPEDTTAGGHEKVQGVDTVEYDDPISLSTVYLTTSTDALPVEVQSTANGKTSVAIYSKYGSAPAVQGPDPASVIDGTGFLPT